MIPIFWKIANNRPVSTITGEWTNGMVIRKPHVVLWECDSVNVAKEMRISATVNDNHRYVSTMAQKLFSEITK